MATKKKKSKGAWEVTDDGFIIHPKSGADDIVLPLDVPVGVIRLATEWDDSEKNMGDNTRLFFQIIDNLATAAGPDAVQGVYALGMNEFAEALTAYVGTLTSEEDAGER